MDLRWWSKAYVRFVTNCFYRPAYVYRHYRNKLRYFYLVKNHVLHISFIGLATFILLLHAMTSHHHVDTRLQAGDVVFSHQCHDSVLKDIFGIDLGDHHLEEFQISTQLVSISPDFLVVDICRFGFVDLSKVQPEDYFVVANDRGEDLIYLTAFTLRGPPALML